MNNMVICPICRAPFCQSEDGHSLFCLGEKRHCFDLSASGYVNLARNQKNTGDSREAVRARVSFLGKGYYAPVMEALRDTARREIGRGLLVDAGCGTGYYTNRLSSDPALEVLGFDLSKHAVDAAAKEARAMGLSHVKYAVCGIYDMPLGDGTVDGVLSMFAPCATEEFYRVLKKDGVLIVAGAGEDHLLDLKQAVYDTAYKNDVRADLPSHMRLTSREKVTYHAHIDSPEDVRQLFSMTPYAYRTSARGWDRLSRLDSLSVCVDVDILVYRV